MSSSIFAAFCFIRLTASRCSSRPLRRSVMANRTCQRQAATGKAPVNCEKRNPNRNGMCMTRTEVFSAEISEAFIVSASHLRSSKRVHMYGNVRQRRESRSGQNELRHGTADHRLLMMPCWRSIRLRSIAPFDGAMSSFSLAAATWQQ